MRRSQLVIFVLFVVCHLAGAQITSELYTDSHDVTSMSPWGPYSKQYSGISHIEDITSGRRVDFSVIPGFYRRSYSIPNVLFESGCYPWQVNPSMTEITYRDFGYVDGNVTGYPAKQYEGENLDNTLFSGKITYI